MKTAISLLVLMLTCIPLPGYTLEIKEEGIAFSSSSASVSIMHGKPYISLGQLSYGDGSSSPLLKSIEDPYEKHSFDISPKPWTKSSETSALLYSSGPLSLFWIDENRFASGASYMKDGYGFFVLAPDKEDQSDSWQISSKGRGFYFGGYYNYLGYKILFISSLQVEGVIDTFVSLSYLGENTNLELYLGDIAPFSEIRDRKLLASSLYLERGCASISVEYTKKRAGIFTGERAGYEYKAEAVLSYGGLEFKGTIDGKMEGNGNYSSKKKYSVSFENGSLSIGDDANLSLSLSFDKVSFSTDGKKAAVSFREVFTREAGSVDVSLSDKGKIDVSIKLQWV